MRLLILGGNGQLGRELTVALSPLGEVVVATRDGGLGSGQSTPAADLERPDQLVGLLREVAADVVVNAAAYTAVDKAEEEPELAHRVNAEAPEVLAAEVARTGSLLVHYSTDYVFGGAVAPAAPAATRSAATTDATSPVAAELVSGATSEAAHRSARPWRECDPAAPVNVYGWSKLCGEDAIRDSDCRHLILRTSWLYATHGTNFVRTMLRLARERDELRIVDDQLGAPTWARPLAAATATLLARLDPATANARSEHGGTYHLAAAGETTWHAYATRLFRLAREHGLLSRAPSVTAITSAEFGAAAPRPPYSVLDSSLLEQTFGLRLPDWKESLAHCLADLAASQ